MDEGTSLHPTVITRSGASGKKNGVPFRAASNRSKSRPFELRGLLVKVRGLRAEELNDRTPVSLWVRGVAVWRIGKKSDAELENPDRDLTAAPMLHAAPVVR